MFIIISISEIACVALNGNEMMSIYKYHSTNQYFQLIIPRTGLYEIHDVSGDRCNAFLYPIKDEQDTTRIYISNTGFESCDCSYIYSLKKVKYSCNDSVFNVRFAGDPDDGLLYYRFLMLTNQGDTVIAEYKEYEDALDSITRTRWGDKKILSYLGPTKIPQLKDTTILEGYDEKNLAWKEVKIKSKKIVVGYINAPQKYKAYYDNILSTLKLIDTTSIDLSKNSLILK